MTKDYIFLKPDQDLKIYFLHLLYTTVILLAILALSRHSR